MFLKRKAVYIVLSLVIISLVGLIYIQVSWLDDGLEIASQKFDNRVFKAFESFRVHSDFDINNLNQNSILEGSYEDLKTQLNNEFSKALVPSDFRMAILDNRGEILAGDSLTLGSKQCTYPMTCDYSLAIAFPQKQAALYKEIGWTMTPSILSILILAASFVYVFTILSKQKKASLIKNDFINNMTHEFKTPLASISLSNHLLKQNIDKYPKSELKSYLDVIELETKRLQTHIDKILQVALLDSGNFKLDNITFDMNITINKVVGSFDPLLNQQKVKITLDLCEYAIIRGDQVHLSNVLYNLLDNAIKFSLTTPEIIISTKKKDNEVVLTVSDNGIGIEQDAQQYIYEKFFRANSGNVHNVKGFGLGLNYVKNVIEAHKGSISLVSKLNEGTTFNISFPI